MSHKFDSLPPDLKAIAQEMIDEKFPKPKEKVGLGRFYDAMTTTAKATGKATLTTEELSRTMEQFSRGDRGPDPYWDSYYAGHFGSPTEMVQTVRLNFRGGSGKIYASVLMARDAGRPGAVRKARMKMEDYAGEHVAFMGNEEEFERQYRNPTDYALEERERSDRMKGLMRLLDDSALMRPETAFKNMGLPY